MTPVETFGKLKFSTQCFPLLLRRNVAYPEHKAQRQICNNGPFFPLGSSRLSGGWVFFIVIFTCESVFILWLAHYLLHVFICLTLDLVFSLPFLFSLIVLPQTSCSYLIWEGWNQNEEQDVCSYPATMTFESDKHEDKQVCYVVARNITTEQSTRGTQEMVIPLQRKNKCYLCTTL